MQCFKRGALGCASTKCTVHKAENGKENYVCPMDLIIQKLNAFSPTNKIDELRAIILNGLKNYTPEMEEAIEEVNQLLDKKDGLIPYSFLLAVKLADAKKIVTHLDYPNFVYDRHTGLIFFDIHSAKHDQFMTFFYWIRRLKEGTASVKTHGVFSPGNREMFSISTVSEDFIKEGFGFFSSSVYMGMGIPRNRGYPITISESHKLTYQEKQVFDGYGYDIIKDSKHDD